MAPSLPPVEPHEKQRSDSPDSADAASATTSLLASLRVMTGRCVCRSSNELKCCQRQRKCTELCLSASRERYYLVAIDSKVGAQGGGSASYSTIVTVTDYCPALLIGSAGLFSRVKAERAISMVCNNRSMIESVAST